MRLVIARATATPVSGDTTLREPIDRFTAGGQDDDAACAQHIAWDYQCSVFLRAAPGAAVNAQPG